MVKVDPNAQAPETRGGNYVETPEIKGQWRRLRKLLRDEKVLPEGTISVKGYLQKVLLDKDGKYFAEPTKDRKTGEDKTWFHVKVVPVITDPRIVAAGEKPLVLLTKKVGASFFDGRNRDGSRSPIRGGMYDVHYAALLAEPSEGLVRGREAWDTDDYVGPEHGLLIELLFRGMEEEGSQYYGTKANLKIFVNGFKVDPARLQESGVNMWGDDDDEAEEAEAQEAAQAGESQASPTDDDDIDDDF